MAINQLSTTNTFQEWLSATQQLIAVANTITDGYTLTTTSNIKLTGSGETLNVSNTGRITNLVSNSINANTIFISGISGRDFSLNVANSIWVGGNVTITNNLTVGNVTITGTQVLACTEFGAMTASSIIQPNGGRLTQSDGSSIIFRLAGNVQQLIANTNFFAGEIISTNVRNSLIATGNVVVTKNLSAGNINTSGNLVVSGNTFLGNGVHVINYSNQDAFRITNRGTGYSFVINDEATDPSPLAINGDGVFIKGDLSPFVTRVGDTTITAEIQQVGSVNANSSFASFTYSAVATTSPHYLMARSRGTKTSPTIVSEGDILGRISSAGWDGAKYVESSRIEFRIDTISGAGGVPALNDMPGEISFLITNDGESSPTERLKVNTSYIWANTQNFQLRSSSGKVTLGSFENLSTVLQTKRASNFIDSTFKISGQTLTDMGMSIFGFSGNGTVYPGFHFARANGTELAPQSVIDGSGLGYISAAGFHDGVTNFSPLNKFTEAARIQFVVQGDPVANSIPGAIDFFTSPGKGTGTSIIGVVHSTRIDANGNVGIGTTAPVAGLHVVRNSSNDAVRILQAGTGNAFVVFDQVNDTTPFRIDGAGSVYSSAISTTGIVTINVSTAPAGGAALSVIQRGTAPAFQVLDDVGDTTMFRIDASGNTAIGHFTPIAKLHVIENSSNDAVRIQQTGVGNAFVVFDSALDTTPFIINHNGDISTSGNVVVGSIEEYGLQTRVGTSPVMPKLKSSGTGLTDGSGVGIFSFSQGISPGLYFARARGTKAAPANLINGTFLGQLSFAGYESTSDSNKFTEAARIDVRCVGVPVANSVASNMHFSTSPGGPAPLNGVVEPIIRAIITSTGNVGIGTNVPTANLQVNGSGTFPALKVIQSGIGDAMVVQDAATDATPFRVDGYGNIYGGANLTLSVTNNGLTGNIAYNTLRFTDLDTTTLAKQPIGKIEFYTSDANKPGVASYILSSAVGTSGGANLVFASSSNGGNTREVLTVSNTSVKVNTSFLFEQTEENGNFAFFKGANRTTAYGPIEPLVTFPDQYLYGTLPNLYLNDAELSITSYTYAFNNSTLGSPGINCDGPVDFSDSLSVSGTFSFSSPGSFSGKTDFWDALIVDLGPSGLSNGDGFPYDSFGPSGGPFIVFKANNNVDTMSGLPQNPSNTLRFTDLDADVVAGQSIGKIEFYTSDSTNPSIASYILSSTVGTSGGSNLRFGLSSSGGTTRETVRMSNSGINVVASNTGIGYSTGSGSSVIQQTSRTTPVYIHAGAGSITLFSAAGSTTATTFTVNNSFIGINDVVIINQRNGTNLYDIMITAVTNGTFNVTFNTTGGTAVDAPVFNFAIIKGATS